MYLNKYTDLLFNTLKDESALSDIKVIKAYPYAKKPTKLVTPIITVSPSGLEVTPCELGGGSVSGSCSVDTDIFIPIEFGSPAASDIADLVITAALELNPIGIKAGEIKVIAAMGVYTAKCSFRFSYTGGHNGQ